MKHLVIKHAPKHLANLFIALNKEFAYSYGDFIIRNTADAEKFKTWLAATGGVREDEIDSMEFTATDEY